MKKSLCIDARMWTFSGIGTYLQELVPRLVKLLDWNITLLIKEKDRNTLGFLSEVKQRAVADSSIYSIRSQILLARSIPLCDLFWSPHYTVPLLPVRALKRVVTIHDLCHLAQKECFSWVKRKGARFLLSQALKQSDLVLSVSSFSQGEILRYFPSNSRKIHVIPSGTPFKEELADCKGLKLPKNFILYVGNIKPHKNIVRLLEAFKRFDNESISLVLAGKVNMSLPVLNSNVQILENLSKSEIAALYAQASLLIQPSLYEGFGLTPLEAMSYGCPVVSSFSSSLPEVCGDSAYYIDPLSVDSLYLGMKKVLEEKDLKDSLILRGFERIKTFSWDTAAQTIANLFLLETC